MTPSCCQRDVTEAAVIFSKKTSLCLAFCGPDGDNAISQTSCLRDTAQLANKLTEEVEHDTVNNPN